MTSKRSSRSQHTIPAEPPERLSDEAAEVWREVVARGAIASTVDAPMLEAYCALVVRWRDAAKRIADEGLVVDGGEKRGAVVHPALAAERQLSQQLREWAPLFNRRAASRRRGTMYDATRRSIVAAGLHKVKQYEGACEALCTLAWIIDEAQREGIEALQKVSYSVIPNYIKACSELQITPASLPVAQEPADGPKAKPVNDIEDMRKKIAAGQ